MQLRNNAMCYKMHDMTFNGVYMDCAIDPRDKKTKDEN